MSNYTPTIDFAAKDGLATNNPAKIISGADFDLEFNAIATAIATKDDNVPVYPPFEQIQSEGNNDFVDNEIVRLTTGTFSNLPEVVVASVDFDFTRPSTSGYEYVLAFNAELQGTDFSSSSSFVSIDLDYHLRLINLQTLVESNDSPFTLGIGYTLNTTNTAFHDLRLSRPNTLMGFNTFNTIEGLLGTSNAGYRASVVVTPPRPSTTRTTARIKGNCGIFIKEIFA